jgi:hypothetical protein
MQGSYFGLWLHSGQGGAYCRIGPTRIAAFAVVNSVGVIVDRRGLIAHGGQRVPTRERSYHQLLSLVPEHLRTSDDSILGVRRGLGEAANTTISLVVTDQKLTFAELQRLAVQVHMSMGRAIQPFGTAKDGDILFAATTAEVENPRLHPTDLAVVASDVMWSAVLASIPELNVPPDPGPVLPLKALGGAYRFAPGVSVEVAPKGNGLRLTPRGERDVFGVPPGTTVGTKGREANTFAVERAFLDAVRFARGADDRAALVLNPGPWQQVGTRD